MHNLIKLVFDYAKWPQTLIFVAFKIKDSVILKRLAIIFLIPIVLLQSCAGLFIMTAFYANRSYIANNLCENRNTAMAPSCAGTCLLMKKLKKERERENKNPELKLKDFQVLTAPIDFRTVKHPVTTVKKETFIYGGNLLYQPPVLGSIFHPPLS
ncbi:hypothetical protein M1D52_06930 [Olivibacter sp. SA151]|uniref:hypothetical protein n=1 Tax=Olivibacter jilunii TaxID=985016 RepID=UPI003F186248